MAVTRIAAGQWAESARTLAAEGWQLADLAGVDRLSLSGYESRFDIAVQLLHAARKERMMVHVGATGDPPTVPSVTAVWPTADFMEREAYDLVGISFEGHPNLTRILMPEEWEGHPLRKDYGVGKVPVEFVPQPFMQIEMPGQAPEGVAAGADVDEFGQATPPVRREEGA